MMVCHIRLQNGLPVWSRSLSGSRCDMFFNGTLLMGEMDVETSDILDIDGNIIEVQRGYRTNNMMLRIVCIWVTYAQFMAIFTRKMMIQPSNLGVLFSNKQICVAIIQNTCTRFIKILDVKFALCC
jgi:hypothetical protein